MHPVWKFSLAKGSLETLIKNLGVFSRVNIPIGYGEIAKKLESVRAAVLEESVPPPLPSTMSGSRAGQTFLLKKDHIVAGAGGSRQPRAGTGETDIVLPEDYAMVTRISKPHAVISRSAEGWQIEDRGSREAPT